MFQTICQLASIRPAEGFPRLIVTRFADSMSTTADLNQRFTHPIWHFRSSDPFDKDLPLASCPHRSRLTARLNVNDGQPWAWAAEADQGEGNPTHEAKFNA